MKAPAPISPRPRGRLQRLLGPWVSPRVFDFWASRLHPTWSWQRPLARIVGREAASGDAVTLTLAPNRHWQGFRAGQHVNIGAEIDGRRITRSYSLCDAPRRDGRIAITIKRVDGGRLSRHLCDRASVGDVLHLGPAFGEMTWPAQAQEPWLLLAGGSGITPMMALVREAAADGMRRPVRLVYWARTRAELCFVDELLALSDAHASFSVQCVLTRETDPDFDAAHGRLDAAMLGELAPDFAQRHVYACGPGGFVETARALLAGSARSFGAEAFTPPPRSAVDEEGGHVDVTLAASGRRVSLPRGQSLLTALEAIGIKPASGCRMGICNTCACGKVSGQTRHLHTGHASDEPTSALRLCVNAASGDLVLDL